MDPLAALRLFNCNLQHTPTCEKSRAFRLELANCMILGLLPAETKFWPRLCFYRCLWFCPQGGGSGKETPPGWKENPPWLDGEHPPPSWMENLPPSWKEKPPQLDGEPPQLEGEPPRLDGEPPPPGSRLRHTVYDRPVRILLECILVIFYTSLKTWVWMISASCFWHWFRSRNSYWHYWSDDFYC